MNVSEAIQKRRSIRAFKNKPISKDTLDKLKQALIWAPSAGNLQSRKFYFVLNEETRNNIVDNAAGQAFLKQAPLLVVACTDHERVTKYSDRGRNLYCINDVSASIENLMLQAAELGLGTCWVGSFDEDKVAELLNIANHIKPIALIPVGYPDEEATPPERVNQDMAIEDVT